MAAVKLHNGTTELRALFVACELPKPDSRRRAFAELRDEYFNTVIAKDIYTVFTKSVRAIGDLPPWDVVVSDAIFDQHRQDQLKSFKEVEATKEAFDSYCASLIQWHKRRVAFNTAALVQESLEKTSALDADDLLQKMRQLIDTGTSSTGSRYDVFDMAGDDGEEMLKEHLSGSSRDRYMPLGLESFDARNKGIPFSGFGVLAGKSGDGKSALALQCMINQATMGYNVLLDTLEMRGQEVGLRLFANVTEFVLGKLIAPEDMTPDERKLVRNAFTKWRGRIKEAKGRLIFRKPRFAPTIETLLNDALIYSPDMVWIDYLSLMAESDTGRKGASQAEALGSMAQFGKTWASIHNIPVMTLAQLNSEGEVKYARKILEDADVSFVIVRDKSRPDVLGIHTRKCRGGSEFDFVLESDYTTMRFVASTISPEELGLGGGPPQVQGWTRKAQEATKAAQYSDTQDTQRERQAKSPQPGRAKTFGAEKPPARPLRATSGF